MRRPQRFPRFAPPSRTGLSNRQQARGFVAAKHDAPPAQHCSGIPYRLAVVPSSEPTSRLRLASRSRLISLTSSRSFLGSFSTAAWAHNATHPSACAALSFGVGVRLARKVSSWPESMAAKRLTSLVRSKFVGLVVTRFGCFANSRACPADSARKRPRS